MGLRQALSAADRTGEEERRRTGEVEPRVGERVGLVAPDLPSVLGMHMLTSYKLPSGFCCTKANASGLYVFIPVCQLSGSAHDKHEKVRKTKSYFISS